MARYFGTEAQQRLQAQAEASTDFIASTPGACQTGRTMGCDDIGKLGWDAIDGFLARDGVCGFRLIARDQVEAMRARLDERGFKFDSWDVYLADRATALAAIEPILERGLPDDLVDMATPTDADGEDVEQMQALMAACGVVPFSGAMLVGTVGKATTVGVGAGADSVAGVAHSYMPHNAHSPFRHHAWGGLVAVDPSQRGKGVGNYVNARMIADAFRLLGATHIYELVSGSNEPSKRMVQACGLRPEPLLVCGVASLKDSARLTR